MQSGVARECTKHHWVCGSIPANCLCAEREASAILKRQKQLDKKKKEEQELAEREEKMAEREEKKAAEASKKQGKGKKGN
jgi:hypothetical protein